MSSEQNEDALKQAGPSSAPICAVCHTQPSKYTCPRCSIKTCSLPCSREHKTATKCSGERDRTDFVPLKDYGYSTLMNDYVFLEDVGRKVEEWGRDIVRNGIARREEKGRAIRGESMRGGSTRGRGRGRGRTYGHGQEKRNFLAVQLGLRDIDMDVLPSGMERARRNKSSWDSKKKQANLTLEFIFQLPSNPITKQKYEPLSLITDNNAWDRTVKQLIHTSLKSKKGQENREAIANWLSLEDDESIPSSVLCLMKCPRGHDSLTLEAGRQAYYKLDWTKKMSLVLRHKHFVEFPTILLVDESAFDGILVDEDGAVEEFREHRPKRLKLDPTLAKKTLSTLVGGYGSEDEEEDANTLGLLDQYSESEEDGEPSMEGDVDEEEIRDVLANTSNPNGIVVADEDEEDLDWGDEEIAEDEATLASLSAVLQKRGV